MAESNLSLPTINNTRSANDPVFLEETRLAAMRLVSINARKEFHKFGMTSQGVIAYLRSGFASLGIDLEGSPAEHAAHLVDLRSQAAANDDNIESKKSA